MESKRFFPMYFDISQKNILVVGGGKIAARRIRTLLRFAEQLTVLAPQFGEELLVLQKEIRSQRLTLIQRAFTAETEGILEDMDIVLAATDCPEVNQRIVTLCREKQILVNTADDKHACDFYFPSIIEKDEVVIGLNSGGKDPGKVKEMRRFIEGILYGLTFTEKNVMLEREVSDFAEKR